MMVKMMMEMRMEMRMEMLMEVCGVSLGPFACRACLATPRELLLLGVRSSVAGEECKMITYGYNNIING